MSDSRVLDAWPQMVAEPDPPWIPVFTDRALSGLGRRDEPPTAGEAELSGPWRVVTLDDGDLGLFRPGDAEAGGEPLVRVGDRQTALLAAAALPALGRRGRYRLDEVADGGRYTLWRRGIDAGSAAVFLTELAAALDGLEALVRSPEALALVLEAAGSTALEQAGRRLGLRLAADDGSEPDAVA